MPIQDGERRTISVQHKFDKDELAVLGKTLAEKHGDRDTILSAKKVTNDDFKKKLSEIEAEISEAARKRREGYEMKPKECVAHRNPEKKCVEWVDPDTGAVVREDRFTDEDYQLELHDSVQVSQSVYAAGTDAYEEGKQPQDNPHDAAKEAEDWEEWNGAWHDASNADLNADGSTPTSEAEAAEDMLADEGPQTPVAAGPETPFHPTTHSSDAVTPEAAAEVRALEQASEATDYHDQLPGAPPPDAEFEPTPEEEQRMEADEAAEMVVGDGSGLDSDQVKSEDEKGEPGIDASLPEKAALPEKIVPGSAQDMVFQSGRKAYKDDLDWDANPHKDATSDSQLWQEGWTAEMSGE